MNTIKTTQNRLALFIKALLHKDADNSNEIVPAKMITKETERLWSIYREKKQGEATITDFKKEIVESFNKIISLYSKEELDKVYFWPRYVRLFVKCQYLPISILVEYIEKDNYRSITKSLYELSRQIKSDDDDNAKRNIDNLAEAVYMHIVEDINCDDIPAILALGRIQQVNGNYEAARTWYARVMESDTPVNGVTAMLSSFEEEVKKIIGNRKTCSSKTSKQKICELNKQQEEIYCKWCKYYEDMSFISNASVENQKVYVMLMTSRSRFERGRGNYDKALNILEKIPMSFPESHRIYSERAMLYQLKPSANQYYDINKAIEYFIKADEVLCESTQNANVSSRARKSILVPLANAYFQAGMYDNAAQTCDYVLKFDPNENNAINLKSRIKRLNLVVS